jgi:hypothetical protein
VTAGINANAFRQNGGSSSGTGLPDIPLRINEAVFSALVPNIPSPGTSPTEEASNGTHSSIGNVKVSHEQDSVPVKKPITTPQKSEPTKYGAFDGQLYEAAKSG